MYNIRKITEDLYYIGSDDIRLELFENIHPIEKVFLTTLIFY